jgi:hypothetical protein
MTTCCLFVWCVFCRTRIACTIFFATELFGFSIKHAAAPGALAAAGLVVATYMQPWLASVAACAMQGSPHIVCMLAEALRVHFL